MVDLIERIAEAARERSQSVAARADRPSQRRSASQAGPRPVVSARALVQILDGEGEEPPVHFRGEASTYEQGYEMYDSFGPYMEIVSAGAGATSLARPDLDVPLVLQHDSLRRIARTTNGTLTLTETDSGLQVDAPNLNCEDRDVEYIVPKIRAGLVDEMSFMFRITKGIWSPDYTEFRIVEYDIHRGDVAIVGYGANPYTSIDLREAVEAPATKRGSDVITLDDTRLLPLLQR